MKTLGALAATYAAQEQTTALLIRITRQDSAVLGFTTHDRDLVYSGVAYHSIGFSPSQLDASSSLAVDNLDAQFLLDSDDIAEGDLLGGKYDYAKVEIWRVDWSALSAHDVLFTGKTGEVTIKRATFTAEARSLTQALNQTIGRTVQRDCDADLGDARCKVNLAPLTVTGTVTSVQSAAQVTDTSRAEAANYFDFGRLTFTSGLNAGLSMEVKSFGSGGVIAMKIGFPYLPAVGDAYSLYPGCDKSSTDCKATFSNYANYRGFPTIIGIDAMLRPGGM